MIQFEKKLKKLSELQVLYQTYPNPDLKRALKVLEEDILNTYRQERYFSFFPFFFVGLLYSIRISASSGMEEVLLQQSGIPEYQCEGLCVHFYASPMALLKHKTKGKPVKGRRVVG